MEEKKDVLTDNNAEQVSGGARDPYGLTCRRCGCHLSVIKWRDYGGYCMKCSQILRKERMSQ